MRVGRRCLALALATCALGCGGPAVPVRGPAGTALAPDAQSAPLPTIGSSFEEPAAETEPETSAPAGHHGGHGHAH